MNKWQDITDMEVCKGTTFKPGDMPFIVSNTGTESLDLLSEYCRSVV